VTRYAASMANGNAALAKGLGWFSLGLGLSELLAPNALARWLGMPGSEAVLRAYGVREIGTGLGIFASGNPAGWMWGRVGGDALDIATLAGGLHKDNANRGNVAFALGAVLGLTVLDAACAGSLSRHSGQEQRRLQRQALIEAYSRRSGFKSSPVAMRGVARDFKIPDDMRTPAALRPLQAG
jgi:hypothetical protein